MYACTEAPSAVVPRVTEGEIHLRKIGIDTSTAPNAGDQKIAPRWKTWSRPMSSSSEYSSVSGSPNRLSPPDCAHLIPKGLFGSTDGLYFSAFPNFGTLVKPLDMRPPCVRVAAVHACETEPRIFLLF